jgi:cupin fold WbuC family metalloprotein
MLIALDNKAKIRPHCHLNKVESFHIIKGALNVDIYDSNGEPIQTIKLAADSSNEENGDGSGLYCQIPIGVIHRVVQITTDVIFREVANGPFRPEDTLHPTWSTDEPLE